MKLDKTFREAYHRHHGLIDRVDYILTKTATLRGRQYEQGSVFFSIQKNREGGWTFLGRRFNSIQGAKKEARKYCNETIAKNQMDIQR